MPRKFERPNDREDEERGEESGATVLDALDDKVVPNDKKSALEYLSEASYPPQTQMQQRPTAEPYNPAAVEQMMGADTGTHGVTQEIFQRAIQQGASPQEAMEHAQQQEQQIAQRAQQGQPVQNMFQLQSHNPVAEILEQDFDGWLPDSQVQRAASLLK